MHFSFAFPLLLACFSYEVSAAASSPEALASRSYFYVGGQYLNIGNMSVYTDQMYVEQLLPPGHRTGKDPVVFLHGQAQTGTNWLNTPDGREGWASWFLRQGHPVYIVDQPQRGRSAWLPGEGTLATYSAQTISMLFTGVQHFDMWPQAHLHTQWPGSGLIGDPIFDQFYASQVQFQNDEVTVENNTRAASASLLDRIAQPVIWVGHSQGGQLSFPVADARPDLIKAMILIEPEGPPFQNRIINQSPGPVQPIVRPYGLTTVPIAYDPPVTNPVTDLPTVDNPPPANTMGLQDCILQKEPARKLANLAKVPMLVVTSESSFHAGYDYCTVEYLQQGGVQAQWLNLSAAGVHGNAHFLFIEENNLQIAQIVYNWIGGVIGGKRRQDDSRRSSRE